MSIISNNRLLCVDCPIKNTQIFCSFGSKILSKRTGIILNDQMADFSTIEKNNEFDLPPSPANFIKPGKRPLSSMCPMIILDQNGDVIFVSGSAGGSKITSAMAYVSLFQFISAKYK